MSRLVEAVKSLLPGQAKSSVPSQDQLIEALRTVYDPEIPVNIYDLGLIYRLEVDDQGQVEIDMTLTAPACPVAGTLPREVGRVIDAVPGVEDTVVHLVWSPPWSKERMSEEAQMKLGLL
ncbi:MAG: SUF system Fe-S cluster assembly protein [Candidatus Thiodiazotropha lotti]|uniref:SUF system Fe-S cluster assembly protein n=1 Tax=Candidatus Thiodiazotropha lotti TaxID=2792787 RepID=A0A9E4N160_9GAMM|nr:SUF system Fe-S cluster assembly protein [Candidatus Thiodiazotropha lotti]ODC00974.1 SUF system Fe-S cluster assembly protein [Candidatus Thiodiazotropha endoloripes]MCG7920693.1 SUF system Fe-S cluster assembly protein [Candidatus Thiodiazotropha lotti]MCG7929843.1 SUF system Fe-S cluster assembly protein [Candidatus Thiodiazotropha lotti]MCG7940621.1 SUF system Fe-S cluster assembly protein [Candidatus Thiodiazotropha lotti]